MILVPSEVIPPQRERRMPRAAAPGLQTASLSFLLGFERRADRVGEERSGTAGRGPANAGSIGRAPVARIRAVNGSHDRAEIVVVSPLKDWTCAACGSTDGGWLTMDDRGPLCMSCADLEHLVFLPAGDAALTRRARSHSRLSAVVVRFTRARKRYERQGLLVEESALDRAEAECLADADARARRRERERGRRADQDAAFERRLAAEIGRLFPGCPPQRAHEIARHTGERGSGRVGRTSAAQALDARAVTFAVVAAARHGETDYDDLLMAGVDRLDSRDRVRPAVDAILHHWRTPAD
jgi:hypothetical protein